MLQSKDRVADWIKNKKVQYAAYKAPTLGQRTHTDKKWGDGKKTYHANGNDKRVRVTILMSDKIDFKRKAIKKDKEGHYIMTKGSIKGEDFHSSTYMHLIQENPNTWNKY